MPEVRAPRAPQCHRVFTELGEDYLNGMCLSIEKAEAVLRLLLEGNSVSSVERLAEVQHTTTLKVLVRVGGEAERMMRAETRNVRVKAVEADGIQSFVGCKERHRKPGHDAASSFNRNLADYPSAGPTGRSTRPWLAPPGLSVSG